VKDAINIPHREMTATRMAEYPKDKVFVVYCAGRIATEPISRRYAWRGSACR
jgi:hypothetical protein